MLRVPAHGVPLPTYADEISWEPSPADYNVDSAWSSGTLARSKSQPSYTMGLRLKSRREREQATGHKEPPAPGGRAGAFAGER